MKGLILILAFLVWISNAYTQVENYSIGKIYTIYSEVLDERRKIAIYTPSNYEETKENYQVLYVLDGEWNFPFITALSDKLGSSGDLPKMIVIGIFNTNRSRDLTPPGINDNKLRFGGAEVFLNFLTEELKPWIESKYRTHPYSVLAGHSFGGLFTLYAMMKEPNSFQSYIALSPSLGRNNEQQVKLAKKFFSQTDIPASSLYLAIGNEGGYTKLSTNKFKDVIDESWPPMIRFKFESLKEENHVSITTTGFLNGLKFIYEGFNAEKLSELGEIFLVETHYKDLSKRFGYEITVPEYFYQKFVNEQIAEREYDYALFILNKYKKYHPNSPYLLAHYADVHLLMGNFKKAKEHFLKLKQIGIEDERIDSVIKKLEKV